MTPFRPSYFERPTLEVARDLVGMLLVREEAPGTRLVGRIVETEAYLQDDPACHGWGLVDAGGTLNRKARGAALFGAPGTAYVYLIYGNHWLLNVVTEPEGVCGAVLLRAVEPVEGEARMRTRRPAARRARDLTNGPGKLTQAFDVDGRFHDRMLTEPPLYLAPPDDRPDWRVASSSRIGITRGVEHPWRFYAEGHPFVSPGRPSDHVAAEKRTRKRRL